jgi:hypothetical protein
MLKQPLRHFAILNCYLLSGLMGGILCNDPALALPGQTIDEVKAWIQANPTLSPRSGEVLFVQKSDTAAQRFTFQASVMSVGKVRTTEDRGKIQSESMSLFDAVHGVSFGRLKEALRKIYGVDIYQDFNRSQLVYEYPDTITINQSRLENKPLKEDLKGQLRRGDRYAYWIEVAQPKQGKARAGEITVFLKSDLGRLARELRDR